MNIETERLLIRDPSAEDWRSALNFLADSDVMRCLMELQVSQRASLPTSRHFARR